MKPDTTPSNSSSTPESSKSNYIPSFKPEHSTPDASPRFTPDKSKSTPIPRFTPENVKSSPIPRFTPEHSKSNPIFSPENSFIFSKVPVQVNKQIPPLNTRFPVKPDFSLQSQPEPDVLPQIGETDSTNRQKDGELIDVVSQTNTSPQRKENLKGNPTSTDNSRAYPNNGDDKAVVSKYVGSFENQVPQQTSKQKPTEEILKSSRVTANHGNEIDHNSRGKRGDGQTELSIVDQVRNRHLKDEQIRLERLRNTPSSKAEQTKDPQTNHSETSASEISANSDVKANSRLDPSLYRPDYISPRAESTQAPPFQSQTTPTLTSQQQSKQQGEQMLPGQKKGKDFASNLRSVYPDSAYPNSAFPTNTLGLPTSQLPTVEYPTDEFP